MTRAFSPAFAISGAHDKPEDALRQLQRWHEAHQGCKAESMLMDLKRGLFAIALKDRERNLIVVGVGGSLEDAVADAIGRVF